jgi:hypothetical protein
MRRFALVLGMSLALSIPITLIAAHIAQTGVPQALANAVTMDSRISSPELRKLAQYHGTKALKITEDTIFIRRGGKWLPIAKRNDV